MPGIPSVKEKGVELGDMNARLLQKIEELTLYLIELKKQNEQQQKAIDLQNLAIEELKLDKYNSKSKS